MKFKQLAARSHMLVLPGQLIRSALVLVVLALQGVAANSATQNFKVAGQELGVSTYESGLKSIPKSTITVKKDTPDGGKLIVAKGNFFGKTSATVNFAYDSKNILYKIDVFAKDKDAQSIFSDAHKGLTQIKGDPSAFQSGNGAVKYILEGNSPDTDLVRFSIPGIAQEPQGGFSMTWAILWGIGIFGAIWTLVEVSKGAKQASLVVVDQTGSPEPFKLPPNYVFGQLEDNLMKTYIGPKTSTTFIMLGDPAVRSHFYAKLQSTGSYSNGTILASMAKAQKLYIQSATDLGLVGCRVVKLKLPRKEIFKGSDVFHVVLAGSPELMDAKLKEIGMFLQIMSHKGYLENVPLDAEGRFVLREDGSARELSSTHSAVDWKGVCMILNRMANQNNAADQGASFVGNGSARAGQAGYALDNTALASHGHGDLHEASYGGAGNSFDHTIDQPFGSVNPANGMPMVANTNMDVTGHTYGSNDF